MDDGDHSTSSDEEHNTTCASPDVNRKPKLKNKTISTSSSTSFKKSGRGGGRRLMQKRVVSVPIADIERSRPKGNGEGAPPPDSWTWRKYGQKPIKGSPYPRGYYRCSSSKGCPARKQVERSRLDPTTLLVTYTSDHNHPSPSTHHNHHQQPPPPSPLPSTTPNDVNKLLSNEYCTINYTNFSPDLDEDSPLVVMAPAGLCWHPFMVDTSLAIATAPFSYDDDIPTRSTRSGEEEDSLFEGLGELPECAMVFRRAQNNRHCSSFPAASS